MKKTVVFILMLVFVELLSIDSHAQESVTPETFSSEKAFLAAQAECEESTGYSEGRDPETLFRLTIEEKKQLSYQKMVAVDECLEKKGVNPPLPANRPHPGGG